MFNQAGLQLFLWLQNSSLSEVLQDERIKMFLCASSEVSQFPVCINQNQTQKKLSKSLTHSLTLSDKQIRYLHLQRAILCLVCEVSEAVRQHENHTKSHSCSLLKHLGSDTKHTNWHPVQMKRHPVQPERAHPDIPGVPMTWHEVN